MYEQIFPRIQVKSGSNGLVLPLPHGQLVGLCHTARSGGIEECDITNRHNGLELENPIPADLGKVLNVSQIHKWLVQCFSNCWVNTTFDFQKVSFAYFRHFGQLPLRLSSICNNFQNCVKIYWSRTSNVRKQFLFISSHLIHSPGGLD